MATARLTKVVGYGHCNRCPRCHRTNGLPYVLGCHPCRPARCSIEPQPPLKTHCKCGRKYGGPVPGRKTGAREMSAILPAKMETMCRGIGPPGNAPRMEYYGEAAPSKGKT